MKQFGGLFKNSYFKLSNQWIALVWYLAWCVRWLWHFTLGPVGEAAERCSSSVVWPATHSVIGGSRRDLRWLVGGSWRDFGSALARGSPAERAIPSGRRVPLSWPRRRRQRCRLAGYAEKGLGVQTCTPAFNVTHAYIRMLNAEGSLIKTKVVA